MGIEWGEKRPSDPTQSKLKAAVTRASRKVDRITQQYGAHDIPSDHPLHALRNKAQQEHRSALRALMDYQDKGGH